MKETDYKILCMFLGFIILCFAFFSVLICLNQSGPQTPTVSQIEQEGEDIFEFCNERGCFLSKVQLEYILEKHYDKTLVHEAIKDAPYSSWAE